jgi:hypothetical protein
VLPSHHGNAQPLVQQGRLVQCLPVLQDLTGPVPLPDDVPAQLHLHILADVGELLDQRQPLDSGLVPTGENQVGSLLLHGGPEIEPAIPQRLGPAIHEELHGPGHAVPVDGGCEDQDIVGQQLVHEQIVVVAGGLEAPGVVSLVQNETDRLLGQIDARNRQVADDGFRQQRSVALAARTPIEYKDLHRGSLLGTVPLCRL